VCVCRGIKLVCGASTTFMRNLLNFKIALIIGITCVCVCACASAHSKKKFRNFKFAMCLCLCLVVGLCVNGRSLFWHIESSGFHVDRRDIVVCSAVYDFQDGFLFLGIHGHGNGVSVFLLVWYIQYAVCACG